MITALRAIQRFCQHEDGPTTTEYAVLILFVLTVCATAIVVYTDSVDSIFEKIGVRLEVAVQ